MATKPAATINSTDLRNIRRVVVKGIAIRIAVAVAAVAVVEIVANAVEKKIDNNSNTTDSNN
jgi:hypothetical protein